MASDTPRKLTNSEINSIVNGITMGNFSNPIIDNTLHIHREKTRKKLETVKIRPSKISELSTTIIDTFFNSLISNGEAVGVNAAQCIGEPTTQMTLNSVAPSTRIVVRVDGKISVTNIGDWIDKLIEENPSTVTHIPKNCTEYQPLPSNHIVEIMSPTENGFVSWNRVTAVTRHYPEGDLIEFSTRTGRTVNVTKTKSMLVWNPDTEKLEQRNGSDTKILDMVPIIYNPVTGPLVNYSFIDGIEECERAVSGNFNYDLIGQCSDTFMAGFFYHLLGLTNNNTVILKYDRDIFALLFSCNSVIVNIVREGIRFNADCKKYIPLILQHTKLSERMSWALQKMTATCHIQIQEGVYLDEIICLNNVPACKYVYDLTVPDTTNFSLSCGLCVADTFHSAGISAKNVTLGFPRAKELFNATKSPSNPTCTVYLLGKNSEPSDLHFIDKFQETHVNQVLTNWTVFSPEDFKEEYWHQLWFDINIDAPEISSSEWVLRFTFDIKKLYDRDITLKDISKKLSDSYSDIRCIPSPLNLGIVDVFVNCTEINITGSRSPELSDITDDWEAREFYMNKIVSPRMRGHFIGGIPGITQIYKRKVKSNETFSGMPVRPEITNRIQNDEEWIADTDGTNLIEILSRTGVDTARTMSNDMWEIYNIFGIEAVRNYLFLEFMNIAGGGGSSINPVHIQILVDKMTYTGSIRAIDRFGVETAQYDPIARATFEEVMSQIITSAIFSEKDNLNGISSNIVLGTKINAGTGRAEFVDIPLVVKQK